jgi:hypothetical protein
VSEAYVYIAEGVRIVELLEYLKQGKIIDRNIWIARRNRPPFLRGMHKHHGWVLDRSVPHGEVVQQADDPDEIRLLVPRERWTQEGAPGKRYYGLVTYPEPRTACADCRGEIHAYYLSPKIERIQEWPVESLATLCFDSRIPDEKRAEEIFGKIK